MKRSPRWVVGLVAVFGLPVMANPYQIGHHPATAALPSTPEVRARLSAFMGIASALPLIPDAI